ncbi:hypothetical protein BDZ89DRAFT_359524 [Hymenopellis radicata]|nr:hypothetical protein BDZ89DRAFT_359524 [Hymenopellis radicata]
MLFVKISLTILAGIALVNAQRVNAQPNGNETVVDPPAPVPDPGNDTNVTRSDHYNRVTGRDESSILSLATGTDLSSVTSAAASYLSEATGQAGSVLSEASSLASSLLNGVTATATGTEKTGSAATASSTSNAAIGVKPMAPCHPHFWQGSRLVVLAL